MAELLDLLIELYHEFKYGRILNSRINFKKKLETTPQLEKAHDEVKTCVHNELSQVRPKDGNPTYAYLHSIGHNYYKVFILNDDKSFYCRLQEIELDPSMNLPQEFFVIL